MYGDRAAEQHEKDQPSTPATPKFKLSTVQREVLQQAADDGGIDRWSVDGSRLRTLRILFDQSYLAGIWSSDLHITDKGREALR